MFTKLFANRSIAFVPLFALLVLAIFGILTFLTGCSSAPKTTATASAEAPVVQKEEPVIESDGTNAFGDTVEWENQMSLSVSAPAPFEPSELAAGMVEGHSAVVFEFTLTNNSDENYDPMVFGTVASGSVEAPGVFDTSVGISFPPTTVLLPGASIKWSQAYSVADPADIVMQVEVGFMNDPAIFTNHK